MSNDERQRQMDFIVAQQAKFAVDIDKLQEAQAELTKKHNHLTEALTAVVGMVGKIAAAQELSEARFAELALKHTETDERLNALINVVERYISRNGKGPPLKRRPLKSTGKSKEPRKKK